jgi:hypothetical protein
MSFYLKNYFLRVLKNKLRNSAIRRQGAYVTHSAGLRKPPPEGGPQPSVPCHSRQTAGGRKMTERRVRIDFQADLL